MANASGTFLLADVVVLRIARDVVPFVGVLHAGCVATDVQDHTLLTNTTHTLASTELEVVAVGIVGFTRGPVGVGGSVTVWIGSYGGPSPCALCADVVEADEVGFVVDNGIDLGLLFGVVDSGKFASPLFAFVHGIGHGLLGIGEEVALTSVGLDGKEGDSGSDGFHGVREFVNFINYKLE